MTKWNNINKSFFIKYTYYLTTRKGISPFAFETCRIFDKNSFLNLIYFNQFILLCA